MLLRSKEDIEPYVMDYKKSEENFLKNYDYAILVKNYHTRLINNGREEKGVTEISFSAEVDSVPELTMIK